MIQSFPFVLEATGGFIHVKIHPFLESQTPRGPAFHSPLMTPSFDTWNTVRIRIGVDHFRESQEQKKAAKNGEDWDIDVPARNVQR